MLDTFSSDYHCTSQFARINLRSLTPWHVVHQVTLQICAKTIHEIQKTLQGPWEVFSGTFIPNSTTGLHCTKSSSLGGSQICVEHFVAAKIPRSSCVYLACGNGFWHWLNCLILMEAESTGGSYLVELLASIKAIIFHLHLITLYVHEHQAITRKNRKLGSVEGLN